MSQAAKTPDIEFEKHIEDVLAGKKDEIERSLAEIIEQEKQKARQKIIEMEQEFQKGKEALRKHQDMLNEVAAAAADAREKIRKHVEQAEHCRTMIRRMADQIGQECRLAGGLRQEVLNLYAKADEETRRLQKELESRYGMTASFPEKPSAEEISREVDREIVELSEFAKGLGGPEVGKPEAAEPLEAICGVDETPRRAEEPAAAESQVEEKPREEAAPLPVPDKAETGETEEQEVARMLEARKMTEFFPGGGELRYYQNDAAIVLDGESLLDQMIRFIEDARTLHTHLEGTKSAKEQFFIKRDILNLQEYLRKIIVRAIKLCEKDTCDLPLQTSDIMNIQTVKDILERLSMGNWSDPYDMKSFGEEIFRLRASLFARTTDQLPYRKSILEQLKRV